MKLAAAGAGVLVTLIAAGVFYHTRSLFAVLLLLLVGAAVVIPLLGAVSRLSPRSIGRVVVVGTLAAVLLPAVVSWRLAPPPMAGELG